MIELPAEQELALPWQQELDPSRFDPLLVGLQQEVVEGEPEQVLLPEPVDHLERQNSQGLEASGIQLVVQLPLRYWPRMPWTMCPPNERLPCASVSQKPLASDSRIQPSSTAQAQPKKT